MFRIGTGLKTFAYILDADHSRLFHELSSRREFQREVNEIIREIVEDTGIGLKPIWRTLSFQVRLQSGKPKDFTYNCLEAGTVKWVARGLEDGEINPLILLACSLSSLLQMHPGNKRTHNPLILKMAEGQRHLAWIPTKLELERLNLIRQKYRDDQEFGEKLDQQIILLLKPFKEPFQFDLSDFSLKRDDSVVVPFVKDHWEQFSLSHREMAAAIVVICFLLNNRELM